MMREKQAGGWDHVHDSAKWVGVHRHIRYIIAGRSSDQHASHKRSPV